MSCYYGSAYITMKGSKFVLTEAFEALCKYNIKPNFDSNFECLVHDFDVALQQANFDLKGETVLIIDKYFDFIDLCFDIFSYLVNIVPSLHVSIKGLVTCSKNGISNDFFVEHKSKSDWQYDNWIFDLICV